MRPRFKSHTSNKSAVFLMVIVVAAGLSTFLLYLGLMKPFFFLMINFHHHYLPCISLNSFQWMSWVQNACLSLVKTSLHVRHCSLVRILPSFFSHSFALSCGILYFTCPMHKTHTDSSSQQLLIFQNSLYISDVSYFPFLSVC